VRRAPSRLLTAACIVVLLLAQFGALTHAAWHAHAGVHAHAAHPAHPTDESQRPASEADLCGFDLAFGQVLGGVHAGGALTFALTQGVVSLLDVPAARLRAAALTPKSRSPPLYL
jgi:hypothetical protein